MNRRKQPGLLFRLAYRLFLAHRWLASKPKCKSFGKMLDQNFHKIGEIQVINLERQVQRWTQMQRELCFLSDHKGRPLSEMTKRFSAIDATYYTDTPNCLELNASYTLADQLFVEPHPSLVTAPVNKKQSIEMSRQEIAVALSHIEVWKRVANGNHAYVLVLEDDVYFRREFSAVFDQAWADLLYTVSRPQHIDLVYLSYEEAKGNAEREYLSEYLFCPRRGLWNLSGYVLSKIGANKLLALLPVYGPVDLWMNHQFKNLDVFATSNSLIEQRWDCRSDNSYSILPVLSKLGVLTQERPSTFKVRRLTKPVFGLGRPGTGLTSLAMALSMLGYRCCSDINELPKEEHEKLFRGKRNRGFDAYVNIGSLDDRYLELASLYPDARIIITVGDDEGVLEAWRGQLEAGLKVGPSKAEAPESVSAISELIREARQLSQRFLLLPWGEKNKWRTLCDFLACNPPISAYPTLADRPRRRLSIQNLKKKFHDKGFRKLRFDTSPWIAAQTRRWQGIPLDDIGENLPGEGSIENAAQRFAAFDPSQWKLLDDTFPSNLALFRPENFSIVHGNCATLTLRKEGSYVRDYTSASLCSQKAYQYGRFDAVIKPAGVSGLITGMFLHRNSPRQEIDIEFLGRDTTKLLLNVYYNPGGEGAKFDYGYRGTPILIALGFDASKDFHSYSIEWSSTVIRWFVDDRVVHERASWQPTPIPHLPMQFHINLWPSRSKGLAGRLSDHDLPAHCEIKSVNFWV